MKLKRINKTTATDKKGTGWFKVKTPGKTNVKWVKCVNCGARVNEYWFCWSGQEEKLEGSMCCDNCVIWIEPK